METTAMELECVYETLQMVEERIVVLEEALYMKAKLEEPEEPEDPKDSEEPKEAEESEEPVVPIPEPPIPVAPVSGHQD